MARRSTVVVVVVVCLALATVAAAQTQAGLKGGLALSKVTGEGDEPVQWLTAWSAGGFVTTRLAKGVFFQPEVLFTRKGATFDEEGISAKTTLDYVEFPLLVRFSSSGRVGFDVLGGVAPAVRTRARLAVEDQDTDIDDLLERWDAGLVIGGGLHVDRFSAEVRWTEGLVNVAKSSTDKTRNRTVSVLAAYRF